MKKLIMFSMLIAIAVPLFSGIASAELVCWTICPTNAVPGDDVTITGYDETGEFYDLSTLQVFESNFHGIGDPFYSLVKDGDNLINIEIIDGTVVFELIEDMLSEDVVVWDFFGVPEEGDNVDFRIVGEDGPFDTVAEAIAAGGTCEGIGCTLALPAITVDSNDLPVHEPADAGGPPTVGPTQGQLLVSLAWQPGEPTYLPFTAVVVIDPNVDGDKPNEDFIFSDSVAADGSVTLTFDETDWEVPQQVAVDAVEDLDREDDQSYPIELTVTIDIADPNFGYPTPVVVESSVRVVDNDVPFVSALPDDFELSESDPCTCVDLKVRLSHLPTDDVYVRILRGGWGFGEEDKPIMASLDPPVNTEGISDPNFLTFTVTGNETWNESTMTSRWDVEQTITICPIDNDELTEPWEESIECALFMPAYSEDVRYRVPWFNSDGSNADNPETEPEEESGGEIEETVIVFYVNDNECGAVGYDPLDFNEDCAVGLADFARFYTQWQFCTEPYNSDCDKYWILVPPEEPEE